MNNQSRAATSSKSVTRKLRENETPATREDVRAIVAALRAIADGITKQNELLRELVEATWAQA